MGSPEAAQQQTEVHGGQQQGQQQGTVQQPEFLAIVHNKITELEHTLGSSGNRAEKESAKNRKRALKEVERFLENRAHTPDDKVNFLQTKCTQMITDLHRVEKGFHEAQSKLDAMTREKDKVQFELKKTNAVRDKLEELCRQLQRDNRETLETARRLREEDAAQRQALQVKFSGTVSEVNARMEEQHADRERQQKVNEDLQAKLLELMGSMDSYNKLAPTTGLQVHKLPP
ncbi:myosin-like coiled-coil protein-domain-containing protein [Dunaliella salina]|uniref:Myosin-like coiled-coil protein-domain-containing protein n=1 Tax=Dunaliella salina TaxID=3046 RepID=A0ABQ7FZE6_DUNSA|nr:myosin-like coiled-coil protein-domain-containing protein [Dunaliella salina]|eukprot:KAF5827719.1 myosin-like coiled-coil protein-domain-containing protein [Dunaliella salina]